MSGRARPPKSLASSAVRLPPWSPCSRPSSRTPRGAVHAVRRTRAAAFKSASNRRLGACRRCARPWPEASRRRLWPDLLPPSAAVWPLTRFRNLAEFPRTWTPSTSRQARPGALCGTLRRPRCCGGRRGRSARPGAASQEATNLKLIQPHRRDRLIRVTIRSQAFVSLSGYSIKKQPMLPCVFVSKLHRL